MLPSNTPLLEHIQSIFDSSLPLAQLLKSATTQTVFKLSRRESETVGPLYLVCVMAPIYDNDNQLKVWLLSVRDVTAEESEETSKSNFLSLISHKLFTPTAVLKGKVMMFSDGLLGELSDKQIKSIKDMAGQIGKLSDLLQKLVNFVTIESSNLDKSHEQIDLNKFLSEVVKDIQDWHADKNPEVTINIQPNAANINFNKNYLRIIIRELIDNGIKFNLNDPAQISVNCEKQDDYLLIKVTDNGMGIPPEFTDKIFDKFFQVERYFTGNVEGVGLGLAYVRELVNHFGGSVEVDSQLGKGSTFVVKLRTTTE